MDLVNTIKEQSVTIGIFLISSTLALVILILFESLTRRGLRIVEIFGTLLFSFLLVWVNVRQTKMMELERSPHLQVSDYEFEGEETTIYLTNSGRGLVKDLKLVTRAAILKEGKIKRLPDAETSLKGIPKESGRRRLEDSIPGRTRTSSAFKAEPVLSRRARQLFVGFSSATDSLKRSGVQKLGFKLYVKYKTELGEVEEEEVFGRPRVIDLTQHEHSLDLEEAWSAGGIFTNDKFLDYL